MSRPQRTLIGCVENRNFFFSNDTQESVFRSRNRVELRYIFNRDRATDARAVIGILDWEYFVPLDGDVRERYASRHRVRVGVGYRLIERHGAST